MASCSQVESLLQAYIDGELSPAETTIFEQHVVECQACADVLKRQKATSAALFEILGEHKLNHDMTAIVLAHLPEMDHPHNVRDAHEATWRAKHPQKRTRIFQTLVPALVPALLLLLGLALAYSWPPGEPTPPKVGMIIHRDGTALRSEGGSTSRRSVALRSVVNSHERIETGENASLVIGLEGPTHVKVDENTRIKIENERKINVEKGQVWLDVCKGKNLFRVITPQGSITVFGTTFNVDVGDEAPTVTVEEGTVQVENDVTFDEVRAGQCVRLIPGHNPLEIMAADTAEATRWAKAIHPDPEAVEEFATAFKPSDGRIYAEKVYMLQTRGRGIRSITFEWKADPYTSGHCGYYIYVYDDHMRSLFKGSIKSYVFDEKDRSSFELAIPDGITIPGIAVLHLNVVPDKSTGAIETDFTEVSALSM